MHLFVRVRHTYQKMLSTVLRSQTALRALHTSTILRNQKWPQLTNILASEIPPPVQVKSISAAGLLLQDGRLFPSACIFLEGEVLLWDVPGTLWNGWDESKFEVFDVVVPKPGSYLRLTLACTVNLIHPSIARDSLSRNRKIRQPSTHSSASVYKQARHSS